MAKWFWAKQKLQPNLPGWLPYGAAPAAVLGIAAVVFAVWGLFPFGEQTLSWCDMSQQVVPLLAELRDAITGNGGDLFFSMRNAGGMNFWGVFLFFLSSPFSFSVAFVEKADLMLLMNLLVVLKMAVCAFTAALLFRRWLPQLGAAPVTALAVLYAFGGFAMLFYQNLVWLDVMYLFPLLLLAFGRLRRGKPLCFILALSAMLVLNFYLSYMVVAFLLLGFAVYLLLGVAREERGHLALLFGLSCLVSACLTGAVWLPALLQYMGSAREIDLIGSLAGGKLTTNLFTTLPLVFCTTLVVSALPFFQWRTAQPAGRLVTPTGTTRETGNNSRCFFVLLLLMMVPLVLDPVNKMWHAGSYQAFPTRYGYMVTLMGLLVAGGVMQRALLESSQPQRSRPAALISGLAVVAAAYALGGWLLAAHLEDMDAYVSTLWGDKTSFTYLLFFFLLLFLAYFLLLYLFRFSHLSKRAFALLLCLLVAGECFFNAGVYIGAAARSDSGYRDLMDLSGEIEDDDFYRVKAGRRDFDVNLLGAMGYNTVAHYTSLTASDYLFGMKKLGYSSNWMEMTATGGTLLTDALLSNRYTVAQNSWYAPLGTSVYQGRFYQIFQNELYLPLGLRLKGDVTQWELLPDGSRIDVQEALYRMLGGDGALFTAYEPYRQENASVTTGAMGLTLVKKEGEAQEQSFLHYQVQVEGTQALYFDAFRDLTIRLQEPINGSFTVTVNGRKIEEGYPTRRNNGLLYLGTFEDQTVEIEVEVCKDVTLKSFGVYGLDVGKLRQTVANAPAVEVDVDNRSFSAQLTAGEGEFLYLSLPYDEGYQAWVNGEETPVYRVNDTFMAIPLQEGNNQVQLFYLPPGLRAGVVLMLVGAVLLVLFLLAHRRGWLNNRKWLERLALAAFVGAGAVVLVVLYLFPLGVYFLGLK